MKLFRKSQKKRKEADRKRRLGTRRRDATPAALNRRSLVNGGLYLSFWAMACLIAFLGLSSAGPLVQRDQVSRIRITSEIPFSYVSKIETDQLMEAIRQKVPPVFRLDLEPYREFSSFLLSLYTSLAEFAEVPENTPERLARLTETETERFLRDLPEGERYALRPVDLVTLYNQLGSEEGTEVLQEGLIILSEIYRRGVYEESPAFSLNEGGDRLTLFNVENEEGQLQEVQILTEQEALRMLRIQLAAFDVPRASTIALFRLLRSGLSPNLQYDAARTAERVLRSQDAVEPVVIHVRQGATIIEPNSTVTPLQYERLESYRKELRMRQSGNFGLNERFFERILLAAFLVLGSAVFLRLIRSNVRSDHRVFALSGGLILLNLALVRGVVEIGDTLIAESSPLIIQLLPWLTPLILGPVIITILVGIGPGILAAALVSTFNAMMQNNSLTVLLVGQLVCLVAIFYCRNIQLRASLVRAGLAAGTIMALTAVLIAVRDGIDPVTTLYQVIASLATGLVSGILIVGILPILEQLFKYTTDITLLELTDYNHPLLRKMQMEAPGSYHHSLMVANLSENAAAAIDANPLVCRVCSLFHDIGKITKPEYFAENQRSGHNPHVERNPSMSALVIKSHVKEGVALAREYRLPRIITDVIQQHHGTSLIQYFYYKALEKQKSEQIVESIYPNAPKVELSRVNEESYRYEGPVPQFTESAIIMLADSVEAASRSLRKVNPQSINELIESIFMSRLQDGQLDSTPITFKQLARIRESFSFTLLNMLHSRVEYPKNRREAPAEAAQENGNEER
jgi:putative nucleotidyltransferase with HDIG domain